MPTLSSLIKKINDFYRLATLPVVTAAPPDYSGGYSSYDPNEEEPEEEESGDTGLYNKIIDAGNRISDADISSEVLMIAELYKKALAINGGYAYVNRGVSNLVNLLDDEDNEEQMAVEDLLNEISADLRARMKTAGPDTEATTRQMTETKNALHRLMIQEDLEGISGGPAEEDPDLPPEVPEDDAPLGPDDKGQFDPTGGVSPEEGRKGKGRGYSVQTRTYKDWVQSFENERQRLTDELQDPALQLARTGVEARRNAGIRSNLEELIRILEEMRDKTAKAIQLESDLQSAPDEAKQTELAGIREDLKKAQSRRTILKKSLRNHHLAQQSKNLEVEEASARSPEEKFVLQQKIELQKLMASPDKGKDEEIKWRRALINSMTYKKETEQFGRITYEDAYQALPPKELAKFLKKIQEGAAKKGKVTEDYRQKAEQVAALKGTVGPIATKEERQRGVGQSAKNHKWELDKVQFDGLVEHLTQRLATARTVAKQAVTHELVNGKKMHNALKPFVDDVATAATKRDKVALAKASKILHEKMQEYTKKSPAIKSYIWNIRYSKIFYDLRGRIDAVSNWVIGADVTAEQRSELADILKLGRQLVAHYNKNYPPGQKERLISQRGFDQIYYDKSIEALKELLTRIEEKVKGINE